MNSKKIITTVTKRLQAIDAKQIDRFARLFKRFFIVALSLVSLGLIGALIVLTDNNAVLNPKGLIADQQRDLFMFTVFLSLLVLLPVFALTIYIAWKYRASNHTAEYRPDWHGSNKLEALWWGIPCAIILVLAVVTWQSSHQLDPYRAIESDKHPLRVQVVALPWKWLFIYPEQNVASVNYLHIPEDRPIAFEITADAPMNSFWIPQLGGQVYAMAGMTTKLHLQADEPGEYQGASANLSGEGFSGMHFVAQASSEETFAEWISSAKASAEHLNNRRYNELAQPSTNHERTTYAAVSNDLFQRIINKYMSPGGAHGNVVNGETH